MKFNARRGKFLAQKVPFIHLTQLSSKDIKQKLTRRNCFAVEIRIRWQFFRVNNHTKVNGKQMLMDLPAPFSQGAPFKNRIKLYEVF